MNYKKIFSNLGFGFLILFLNFQFFNFNIVFQLYLVCMLTTIYLVKDTFIKKFKINKKEILVNVFWLTPVILSFFYSADFNNGLYKIKTILPIIITPLIYFSLDNKYKIKIEKLVRIVFPLSTLIFGLYILTKLCVYFYQPYIIQYGKPTILAYLKFVYEHRFGYLTNKDIIVFTAFFHKAYYSLAVLISILLLLKVKYKFFKIILFILLSSLLLLFNSMPHIFVYIIFVCTYLFLYLRKTKYLFFIIAGGLFFVYYFRFVFFKLLNSRIGIREQISKCAYKQFKESPLFGYGVGDVKNTLNTCFIDSNYLNGLNFNTHNQYLDVMLSSGLIGLIFFLSFFVLGFKKSFQNKSIELFLFLTLIAVTLLFENIFHRMWGVFMFSVFYSFFNFNSNLNQK